MRRLRMGASAFCAALLLGAAPALAEPVVQVYPKFKSDPEKTGTCRALFDVEEGCLYVLIRSTWFARNVLPQNCIATHYCLTYVYREGETPFQVMHTSGDLELVLHTLDACFNRRVRGRKGCDPFDAPPRFRTTTILVDTYLDDRVSMQLLRED